MKLKRLQRIVDEEYAADRSKRRWPERAAVRYCHDLLDECDAVVDKETFASSELYRLALDGAERLAIDQPWALQKRAGARQA